MATEADARYWTKRVMTQAKLSAKRVAPLYERLLESRRPTLDAEDVMYELGQAMGGYPVDRIRDSRVHLGLYWRHTVALYVDADFVNTIIFDVRKNRFLRGSIESWVRHYESGSGGRVES